MPCPTRDAGAMADHDAFDTLMDRRDSPMCIVTASADGERSGCLVGFNTQASINPRRFMPLISKKNHTYGVARRALVLAVHVLHPSDREMSERFGELTGDEVDKFAGLEVLEGPGQVPVIAGLDWFAGRVLEQIDLGDHVGFLLAPHDGSALRADEGQLGLQAVLDMEPGHEA